MAIVSGDISDCHHWEVWGVGGDTDIQKVKTKDTRHKTFPTTKNYLAQNVRVPSLRNPNYMRYRIVVLTLECTS